MSRLRAKESLELERGDVLGVDPSRSRGLFAAKKEEAYYLKAFKLGTRDSVLHSPEEVIARPHTLARRPPLHGGLEQDPIIYHIALQNGQKFSWHETFRSSIRLLVNTAASEYLWVTYFPSDVIAYNIYLFLHVCSFTTEFFCRDDMFKEICSKTISQFEELLQQYVVNCFDSIGILLIIRILQQVSLSSAYLYYYPTLLWLCAYSNAR